MRSEHLRQQRDVLLWGGSQPVHLPRRIRRPSMSNQHRLRSLNLQERRWSALMASTLSLAAATEPGKIYSFPKWIIHIDHNWRKYSPIYCKSICCQKWQLILNYWMRMSCFSRLKRFEMGLWGTGWEWKERISSRSGEKTPDQDRNGLGLNQGLRGCKQRSLSNGPPVPQYPKCTTISKSIQFQPSLAVRRHYQFLEMASWYILPIYQEFQQRAADIRRYHSV